ncbi:MAG: hypothetical protein IKI29_03125 [Clostridia bacterium]|nr:hypothetical protein [Clostridia bacterium]
MIVRLADFNIDYQYRYLTQQEMCADYIVSDDESVDYAIRVQKREIEDAVANDSDHHYPSYFESLFFYRDLAEWLPLHEAFVFHSACFDVDGVGVAFTAHSGTGKTTHMRLWKDMLGERMTVINGDKPIVRFFKDEINTPYAYGTPWMGKEHYGTNARTRLKHICFINRSLENSVIPLQKKDVVNRIMNQVYRPHDSVSVLKTMQLIDRLLSCCDLWQINCNMDPSAAETAYKEIFKQKRGD